MTECVPFLKVRNVEQTVKWYTTIGFVCTGTNRDWEPDDEPLNWARLEWAGAAFMIGPDERGHIPDTKDAGLWFNVDEVDSIISTLQGVGIEMEIEEKTFYGRKVVSFRDLDGFGVVFSCGVVKLQ